MISTELSVSVAGCPSQLKNETYPLSELCVYV
jgi:hypothetical protein